MESQISTLITKEHYSIANNFVNRVIDILQTGQGKVKAYGVNMESWNDEERLILELNEKVKLNISITTTK